jgi:hypothetical protein
MVGSSQTKKGERTMSNETNKETKPAGKKPNFIAYNVIDRGEGKKSNWREIGVAFTHKDGKGFDILFDVVPLSGKITLRAPETKE